MDWVTFVEAAESTGWVTYVATADAAGSPHVSAAAPGFTEGTVWFATRTSSKKYRNLKLNPSIGFHWPVGSGGRGELAAWGSARIHDDVASRREIWDAGIFGYDLAGFFGSADNEEMAFVESPIVRARLLGPDFVAQRYPEG